ncbi:MAG: hypothetical protein ACI8S3_002060 [Alphaproteobacteria bacterium]|jgi:hypothetical protein
MSPAKMRGLERRLARLGAYETGPSQIHRIIVDVDETEEEVILRKFGIEGPPDGAGLILRQIVAPRPVPGA